MKRNFRWKKNGKLFSKKRKRKLTILSMNIRSFSMISLLILRYHHFTDQSQSWFSAWTMQANLRLSNASKASPSLVLCPPSDSIGPELSFRTNTKCSCTIWAGRKSFGPFGNNIWAPHTE
uniref:Uncharacterized protein n=1 Tax=Cacopsylla melanoneura TaxID=428564 RepID=A0A8D8WZS8_9HEMI